MTRSPITMRWEHVLFLHWPVDPVRIRETLPEGLMPATHDGRAWLGVVAFTMPTIRPTVSPVGLRFHEVNLRTYVRPTGGGPKGVYFYNLDAADWLGVVAARVFFRLPYYHAEMRLSRLDDPGSDGGDLGLGSGLDSGPNADSGAASGSDLGAASGSDPSTDLDSDRAPTFRFLSRRDHPGAPAARVDLVYRPTGEVEPGTPGSLEEFLAENYRLYTGRRPWYCEIDHDPWPLRSAAVDVRENGLFEANGFDRPEGEPLVHYARALDVEAGLLRPVRR